ncbi:hypothetical protein ACA910_000108 [Epithemia clementina (nom. ined.)]
MLVRAFSSALHQPKGLSAFWRSSKTPSIFNFGRPWNALTKYLVHDDATAETSQASTKPKPVAAHLNMISKNRERFPSNSLSSSNEIGMLETAFENDVVKLALRNFASITGIVEDDVRTLFQYAPKEVRLLESWFQRLLSWKSIDRGKDLFIKGCGNYDIVNTIEEHILAQRKTWALEFLSLFEDDLLRERHTEHLGTSDMQPMEHVRESLAACVTVDLASMLSLVSQNLKCKETVWLTSQCSMPLFFSLKKNGYDEDRLWQCLFSGAIGHHLIPWQSAPFWLPSVGSLQTRAYFSAAIASKQSKRTADFLEAIIFYHAESSLLRQHLLDHRGYWNNAENIEILVGSALESSKKQITQNDLKSTQSFVNKLASFYVAPGFEYLRSLGDYYGFQVLRNENQIFRVGESLSNCLRRSSSGELYANSIKAKESVLVSLEDKSGKPTAIGKFCFKSKTWTEKRKKCNETLSENTDNAFSNYSSKCIGPWLDKNDLSKMITTAGQARDCRLEGVIDIKNCFFRDHAKSVRETPIILTKPETVTVHLEMIRRAKSSFPKCIRFPETVTKIDEYFAKDKTRLALGNFELRTGISEQDVRELLEYSDPVSASRWVTKNLLAWADDRDLMTVSFGSRFCIPEIADQYMLAQRKRLASNFLSHFDEQFIKMKYSQLLHKGEIQQQEEAANAIDFLTSCLDFDLVYMFQANKSHRKDNFSPKKAELYRSIYSGGTDRITPFWLPTPCDLKVTAIFGSLTAANHKGIRYLRDIVNQDVSSAQVKYVLEYMDSWSDPRNIDSLIAATKHIKNDIWTRMGDNTFPPESLVENLIYLSSSSAEESFGHLNSLPDHGRFRVLRNVEQIENAWKCFDSSCCDTRLYEAPVAKRAQEKSSVFICLDCEGLTTPLALGEFSLKSRKWHMKAGRTFDLKILRSAFEMYSTNKIEPWIAAGQPK